MNYFSINSFFLGTLLFAYLYLSNIIYGLLCIIYKIRIVDYTILYNPWFSLHQETIMGTKFLLGWLPLGCSVKPLGMTIDEDEKSKIAQVDLPYAFFNKPKYLRTIFRFVPWVTFMITLLTAIVIISNSSILNEIEQIANYLIHALRTMFSNSSIERQQFIIATKEIFSEKNIVVFVFTLLLLLTLLFTPITVIMNWFTYDKDKKNKLQKIFGFITTILFLWLILWKIPKFVFSFFTFSQSITYVTSFFIGLFSAGLICFYTTLFVVKNISQNLDDYKTK